MILVRLLRFAFHLLYHQFAWTYDWVAAFVSAGQWQRWVRSTVPELLEAETVLEVGHGPGHLLLALQEQGVAAIGVDLSPQMGRRARRLLHEKKRSADLVQADARSLPFKSGQFKAIALTFPAEYITEEETWRSLGRVLHPHGRILALLGALPGGRHPLRWLSRLLFRLTGQAGLAEIVSSKAGPLTFFAEIEMGADLDTVEVEGSELFLLRVHHLEQGGGPSAPEAAV